MRRTDLTINDEDSRIHPQKYISQWKLNYDTVQDWTNGYEVDIFDFETVNIGYQGTGS